MQPNVDVVDIVQILELATGTGMDLNWLVPMSHPTVPGSKKNTIQAIATVISNQIGSVTVPDPTHYLTGAGGINPVAGGTTVNDATLNGLDYSLYKWGVGPLRKGTDWQNDVSGGGWRLISATFVTGEMYIVVPKPKISNIISAPDAVARFTQGIQLLPSNTTIGASMYRKLLIMNGAAIVTLPLCNSYPPNVALFISSAEGPRKESTIQCQGANTIYTQSGTLTKLFIGQREFVVLITDGTQWYIQSCSQRMFEQPTLQSSWSWAANTGALNTIPAIGSTLNRTDYPGLWDFVSKLATAVPGAVKTGGAWASNRTYWGTGDGTTTFNTPDMRGFFVRGLDLGRGIDPDRNATDEITPGSAQGFQVQIHRHNADNADANQTFMKRSNVKTNVGIATNPGNGFEYTERDTDDYGGNETRPINTGLYYLINI